MRNAVKHSRASKLLVKITPVPGGVALEVTGGETASAPTRLRHGRRQWPDAIGLTLLEERVAEAGATLAIQSAPAQGTSVRLRITHP